MLHHFLKVGVFGGVGFIAHGSILSCQDGHLNQKAAVFFAPACRAWCTESPLFSQVYSCQFSGLGPSTTKVRPCPKAARRWWISTVKFSCSIKWMGRGRLRFTSSIRTQFRGRADGPAYGAAAKDTMKVARDLLRASAERRSGSAPRGTYRPIRVCVPAVLAGCLLVCGGAGATRADRHALRLPPADQLKGFVRLLIQNPDMSAATKAGHILFASDSAA